MRYIPTNIADYLRWGYRRRGASLAAFLLLGKGKAMSKAKAGALLAIFADVERRNMEKTAQAKPAPWENAERPIEVDLVALHRAVRKARA